MVRRLLLMAVLVAPLAGCGDSDDPAVELVDAESEILAVDNVFDPEDTTVEAGTTITFVNAGRNDHNVIPEDEDAEWAIPTQDFGPRGTAEYRFTEPGEYRYFCSIHGTIDVGMVGTITVTTPGE
ncbi:cupredoxin domain-containing protein [Actinospongicola halichondriae]|uniref:cupredoxin domain-containing protein n=1 Tax=Actinospongicola halichondriae TaxID=3236844 RepID=UPI003D393344